MRIGIDAMGSDHAPAVEVKGALAAREVMDPGDRLVLYGREGEIRKQLEGAASGWQEFIEIQHAEQVVSAGESPVEALRNKPDSSVAVLTRAARDGKIDACVSAGNTGAFVAAAQMNLRRLHGVHRPGIAVVTPTYHGPVVVCDVGANIYGKASHLHQYGVMASLYSQAICGIAKPRVGLLSIGEEDAKGNELVKQARELLRDDPHLNFIGNVEGRDLFVGTCDVMVCDGFVGNVVLKLMEGMVEGVLKGMLGELKESVKEGAELVRTVTRNLMTKFDFNEYGGAPLLGVGGIVIICHGASDYRGIKNAVRASRDFSRQNVNSKITNFLLAQSSGGDMSERLRAVIRGAGASVPDRVMTNADFEKFLDTSDEWITQRTGIKERHVVAEGQTTATLATEAARKALADANLTPGDLDLIICCTVTPEMMFPATACFVQSMLGAKDIPAFDLSAACSGFMYGLTTGSKFIESGMYKRVLVIGADTLSRFSDYTDRTSCILFGDGAGAVVLEASTEGDRGILYNVLHADGTGWDFIHIPGGGSRSPASLETIEGGEHFVKMRGRDVYRFAIEKMQWLLGDCMSHCNLTPQDVDLVIPHQVNIRIITSATEKYNFPMDKVYMNIDRYGNTSAASIPMALEEARRVGRIGPGSTLLMVAFGAGLTWAGSVVRM